MTWQPGSRPIRSRLYGLSRIQDFDDASTDSTICLQVPDSPTECVQSVWTDLGVDTWDWERAGSCELGRRRAQDGAACRRRAGDLACRGDVVLAVNKTAAAAGRRRRISVDDRTSLSVSCRRRPSSASSSTSSAGLT